LKITREFKIGLFAAVAIFLFIWGLNYLKGTDIFSSQIRFYAVYDDVTGLIESNPVSLNGVTIGQINRIRFMPDGSGKILVESIIDKTVAIPSNSISILTGASLTGSREIIIRLGDSGHFINDGDTLKSEIQTSLTEEVGQIVLPLKERAEELFDQIDSVMLIVQSIFNQQTQANINQTFQSVQQTMSTLDKTVEREAERLSAIMANAESISQNLKNNNETLTNILNNFSNISDSIAAANLTQTLQRADQSIENLSSILEKINNGEGSMGLLVNDEQLYRNLDASSKQLELLLEDIRKNPATYMRISVFGR
jgi:phospholipid/cholesterol/gamma-HCH transport system substrate-binding protein